MRKPIPLRWIEEAEARHVLQIARSEAPPAPDAGVASKTPWGARVRRWVGGEPTAVSPAETVVADDVIELRHS